MNRSWFDNLLVPKEIIIIIIDISPVVYTLRLAQLKMRVINVAKRCYNVSLGLHVSGRSSLVFSHQVLRDYSTVTAAVESSEMTPKPFSEIPGEKEKKNYINIVINF